MTRKVLKSEGRPEGMLPMGDVAFTIDHNRLRGASTASNAGAWDVFPLPRTAGIRRARPARRGIA